MDKKEIKAKLFSAKDKFKREVVEIDGIEFEIRQPSVGQRRRMMEAAKRKDGDTDQWVMISRSLIECVYMPNSNERMFDESDLIAFDQLPTGSWYDKLIEKMAVGLNVDTKKAEENLE